MPELLFKGKEFVFNHHLSVPYRPLVAHRGKSVGPADMAGNLIIHGDNLHALKALLPRYAGKVDCIFIDPPYNTGNESWSYNDNVNSPIMREWLSSNPVNKEDMLRHDKWLAMMWPRLRLLRELLSDRGSLWMTLDDNEIHRARSMLDEIFGEDNFVADIAWHARESVQNDTDISTNNVNHLFGYAKIRRKANRRLKASNAATWYDEEGFVFLPLELDVGRFSNPDNDPRGPWKADPFDAPNVRPNLTYPIKNPNTGKSYMPPTGRCWRTEEKNYKKLLEDKRIVFGKEGKGRPQLKVFAVEKKDFGEIETTWWDGPATTTDAIKFLERILPGNDFDNPKPHELVEKILFHTTRSDSLVIDSFAGSGTTAHAVLSLNAKDGGERKFILVECEDYADRITAERVRRVINGYAFEGTKREELLREKLSWTSLKNAQRLLDKVQAIENLEASRFDRIAKTVKDGELIVEGEKKISERVEGLGGGFTFCTLGPALDLDKLLTGETLPDFAALGAWLFHTATGIALDASMPKPDEYYLGETPGFVLWLIYRPDLDFLKSHAAALTLDFGRKIHESRPDKKHLVFAASKFVSNKTLLELGCEYAPLPFALFRV